MQTKLVIKAWPLTALFWLGANVFGFGLAGALFHNFPLAGDFPPDLTHLGRFSLQPALVGGVLFGFVPALPTGLLQYVILRRHQPISRWWIASVAAGVGLMHFFSDGFENARDLSGVVFVSGLLVGWLQRRLLRPAPAGWLPATACGWYVGWLMGLRLLQTVGLRYQPWAPGLDAQQHGLLGLMMGISVSLSAGWLWLRRRPVGDPRPAAV